MAEARGFEPLIPFRVRQFFPLERDPATGGGETSVKGGSGEIRTHDTLPGTTVFKTVAFNHSATLPPFTEDHDYKLSLINFLNASPPLYDFI